MRFARALVADERTDPAREQRQGPECKPRRCAWRERLEEFKTGDGCSLFPHRQAEIAGELACTEVLLAQIKEVEEARNTVLAAAETVTPAPALRHNLEGIGPDFVAVLRSEGISRH